MKKGLKKPPRYVKTAFGNNKETLIKKYPAFIICRILLFILIKYISLNILFSFFQTVMEGFEGSKHVETKTASYDLVTEYDKKTEMFLINTLTEAFPDHKFIGEETMAKAKLTDAPTWVIDPIDGTTNFVHGVSYCCISVGLAVEREVVLGVVCCPPLNQTFSAIKGKGAFLNGRPIHTSKAEELKDSLMALEISLAARPKLTDLFMKRYKTFVTQVQGLRSFGCAEMTLCLVAQGVLDGYQVEYLWPWDVAAGSIIVSEAGGSVLDIDGGKFDFEKGRVIAAGTKKLAEAIVEQLKVD